MTKANICLIEDDELLGETLCDRFRMENLKVEWFKHGKPAMLALERKPYDLVLCDVRLPDVSGVEIFDTPDLAARPPFIFMTAFGSIDEAVGLLKSGAVDFLTKPFDLDQLMTRVHQFWEPPRVQVEPVLGLSPTMRKIETLLGRLADSTETVLVSGESGVGKEVVARLLHDLSSTYRTGNWVPVNCAGIPETLIEAELFGYVKGAYTGAARAHKGYIEQANGGTLFLDEIGDMSLNMQSRLLRVLQERCVTRLGAESPTPVDFRLICATHRDLPAMVRARQFREDLFYRINVISVHIPPLRDRREDILWLADGMLSSMRRPGATSASVLSLEAQQALFAHTWPGNVRELNHALRRAVALSTTPSIGPGDLFPDHEQVSPPSSPGAPEMSLTRHLELSERAFLVATLKEHRGAMTETAARLGISRKTLWEKMRRYGIERSQFNDGASESS